MCDRKYLVIAPSWVGDMVMMQSMLIGLKSQFPGAKIDVLAPAWCAALTEFMPQVERTWEADFSHGKLSWKQRRLLARQLQGEQYTHAILLPNSLKSSLVPWLAKIPNRIGFLGEQRWGLVNRIKPMNKVELTQTVQRFIALIDIDKQSLSTPQFKVSLDLQRKVKAKFSTELAVNKEQNLLAICPGAEFGSSKQWPVQHIVELSLSFIQKGWQIWLFGSSNDQDIANQIVGGISAQLDKPHVSIKNFCGVTSIVEAVVLLSMADKVLSNDSGLMHVAAALNKPLVAIYGSTSPEHTPPLGNNHLIAMEKQDCSPCFKRECPLHHHNCMRNLTSTKVAALLEELAIDRSS